MSEIKVLNQLIGKKFAFYNGDSCEVLKGLKDNSIDYSIFSPPFADLYVYSDSDRDLGNCKNQSEFYAHFEFIIKELFRVLKPGRNLSFHCMDLPTSKSRDGFIGLTDFPGILIKMFQDAGFIYHSRVTIWKDPVVQMQRTKALGLLHKQIKKDSSMSRNGLADYLITMRKPGLNDSPISHTNESFPVDLWQKIASPIWYTEEQEEDIAFKYQSGCWFDINQSNTLQRESARDDKDEKHLCPLQLDVIERAINLWTNPNDIVLTPFGGIGSEGYQAVRMGRKAILIELKPSYFKQGSINMQNLEDNKQLSIFEVIE